MSGSPAKDTAHHRDKCDPDLVETILLISTSTVTELEAAVQVGVRVLEDLKAPLNAAQGTGHPQIAHWLQCIQQVEQNAKPARTVVGVAGPTGAGKSSVINALLDEESLVPTSGMRACTASATEISYNHSNDPEELYRAEVEFITEDDWSQELKALLGDLIEGSGKISPDCYNPDSEAGLAYSKIRAVYPKKTRDIITRQGNDPSGSIAMAREPQVRVVLGSVKLLRASSSPELFEGLQKYIDSKENKEKFKTQMEYWPLIKVVRIYCKAPALSTGVVIVDLPGVGDSNSARAAVSQNYLKACNGIWVTADIQRAINNKAAKQLLGDNFKRQLKYDGAFSTVTFICTKADDILMTEVQNSLNIKDQVGGYWEQVNVLSCRRDELTSEIENLKHKKSELEEQLEEMDLSNQEWEGLQEELASGKLVYPPSDISKKRKREASPPDELSTDLVDVGNSEIGQLPEVPETPLTEDDIKIVLETNKTHERETRVAKRACDKAISKAKQLLAETTAEEAAMQSDMRSLCIRGRSKYVKDAIKRDFALGIKELDQEVAIEEDEANFDPEEVTRDYDELARNLPVFCVSSRAFQKLAGRLEKDAVQTDGFTSLDDTGIPQLQEHAKRVTEGRRKTACQLFLNELNQLLNSVNLWAADGTRPAVTKKKLNVDEQALHDLFLLLDDDLREAVEDCQSSMKHDLKKHLHESFDTLALKASDIAPGTVTGWGKPKPEGGLFWATYKATCRRDGSWRKPAGGISHDFNADLFEPINKQLARSWERVFQRRIPQILRAFAEECKSGLESFYSDAATKVGGTAASSTELRVLDQQKRIYQALFAEIPGTVGAKITESQREANRGFTPVIQAAMHPAYDACVRDRGTGTFVRMKSIMETHVATVRNTMFRQACDSVKAELDSMCAKTEKRLTARVQNLLAKLQRDLRATLAGDCIEVATEIVLTERKLRDQMRPILNEADARFAKVCFTEGRTTSATAESTGREESVIAQHQEDDSNSGQPHTGRSNVPTGTETGVKPEPV